MDAHADTAVSPLKFNAITFCRSSSPTQCPSPLVPLSTILAVYLRRLLHFLTMMLAHAPLKWADPEDSDIPGEQSATSDDSEPPWPPYTVLEESDVWRELRMLARPHSTPLGPEEKFKADSINFQPALSSKTQDRYVVTQLEVNGRLWAFTGVFDGMSS